MIKYKNFKDSTLVLKNTHIQLQGKFKILK